MKEEKIEHEGREFYKIFVDEAEELLPLTREYIYYDKIAKFYVSKPRTCVKLLNIPV